MLKKLYLFIIRHIGAVAIAMTIAFVVGCFVDNIMDIMLVITASLFCLTHYGNSKAWWKDV